METSIAKTKEVSAFQRGWNKLPFGEMTNVQVKIMDALSISSRAQFYRHLTGRSRRSKAECDCIEEIFREAGVTDIWGEE